ncbi:hypothetical protein AX17_000384 [Amanita inopinata Kibby_2008]|nr:hypothetical protein AX17_000384 [Amanita inopinata Kibby_2008]
MPSKKSQHASITLLFYCALVLTFTVAADANIHPHLSHKRLLKKRVPQLLGPLAEAKAVPLPTPSSDGASTTANAITTSQPVASPVASQVSGVLPAPGTDSAASTPSLSTTLSPMSTSTSVQSSGGVSTASVSTSSLVTASPTTVSGISSNTLISAPRSTLTQTEAVSTADPSPTSVPQGAAKTETKRTTLTVIVVIVSCIGGVAILWTVFRKWKLARSSKFDERLQPIDWQPPADGIPDRRRPTSTASSFHSAGHGGYGSDHGHVAGLAPLPDHDFTPLPAHLAPVGGYADLARGPSPQPQMQEAYGHGHVLSRPAYDVNVPLHHQAGYGGHDAYEYSSGASMRY